MFQLWEIPLDQHGHRAEDFAWRRLQFGLRRDVRVPDQDFFGRQTLVRLFCPRGELTVKWAY